MTLSQNDGSDMSLFKEAYLVRSMLLAQSKKVFSLTKMLRVIGSHLEDVRSGKLDEYHHLRKNALCRHVVR